MIKNSYLQRKICQNHNYHKCLEELFLRSSEYMMIDFGRETSSYTKYLVWLWF